MLRLPSISIILVLPFGSTLMGCSDGEPANVLPNATPSSVAAVDASPQPDAANDASSGVDASDDVTQLEASGGDAEDAGEDAPDVGPVSSCDELGTNECFANEDCSADRRCQNAGADDWPVPCCVVGSRGSGAAGQSCVTEQDCESGVCVASDSASVCSKRCATPADCPLGLPKCMYIAMSGSDSKWCLPSD